MADPISAMAAFGAASSIFQIIDFSGKVSYNAAKLMASQDALRENIEIERLTRQHELLIQEMAESQDWNEGPSAKAASLIQRANEISEKSGELLKLLDDLKVTECRKSFRRAFQSTRQAARAVSKRAKIARKQKELQDLTKQLEFAVILHIASKQTDGITLLRGIAQTQADAQSHLQKMGAEALQRYQEIMKSLNFNELNSRHDTVVDAYDDTYQWAVDAPDSTLREWLARGIGLFWVCGKPGSGKSTFMKYLLHSPKTAALLSQSTPKGEKWVIADFFFWFSGTHEQKSTIGLLKGILYKVLLECPELLPVACPQRITDQRQGKGAWTGRKPLDTVRAVARTDRHMQVDCDEDAEAREVRFLLLIDGLDEYDGNAAEMAAVLQDLVVPGRIKICVSCRPWNVFINAMGDTKYRLHLEDYTQRDIEHYVRDQLIKAESSQRKRRSFFRNRAPQAESLIKAVVDKASGVFLWVSMVVRSLIAGFEEGDSIELMQKRVAELPGDLIPYFRLMLDRMSKTYQEITATILVLAGLPQRPNWPRSISLSLLDIWPLVQSPTYYRNRNFALERSIKPFTPELTYEMMQETAQIIRATCRDFLHTISQPELDEIDLTKVSNPWLLHCSTVTFMHRTVYDFFNLEDIRKILHDLCPAHMTEPSIVPRVLLARAKCINSDLFDSDIAWEDFDMLANDIAFDANTDLQVLQDLDDLEIHYIDKYCDVACAIHARAPAHRVLARHEQMWKTGFRNASMRSFVKRLGYSRSYCHGPSSRGPDLKDAANPMERDRQVVRYAFGNCCHRGTIGPGAGAAVELDQLDVAQISLMLAESVSPDELFLGLGRCLDNEHAPPLAKFLRNWLFATANDAIDDAVWLVVKLLIEQGASVPETCQIPTVQYRRRISNEPHYEFYGMVATDSSWRDMHTETVSIKQALAWAVPEARVHEIDEVLARVELK